MENAHLMIFICLVVPLSMMFLIFKGSARPTLGFLLTGLFMCLFAGEINGLIYNNTVLSMRYLTVHITPIVEEVLKAIPVVMVAFIFKPKRQFLLEGAIAIGVGFATLENTCLLFDSASALSAVTIISRGFGAGMMHGISTLAVGYSMTFVSSDRKLSYTGTIAALSAAIIYHSIYNIMVQSIYPAIGILLPIATYIPVVIVMVKKRKSMAAGHDTKAKT